eukprot:1054029-Prorocentrum_minimum.AAC.2
MCSGNSHQTLSSGSTPLTACPYGEQNRRMFSRGTKRIIVTQQTAIQWRDFISCLLNNSLPDRTVQVSATLCTLYTHVSATDCRRPGAQAGSSFRTEFQFRIDLDVDS